MRMAILSTKRKGLGEMQVLNLVEYRERHADGAGNA